MNEVSYSQDHRYAFVDGYKFRKDKTGYYLSTRKIGASRIRLHRYIWQKHNGPIPKGYEINHIDENKDNNEISNFECITAHQHRMFHLKHDYDKMLPVWRKNLDEHARKAAAEWHKSAKGKAELAKARPKHMKKKYVKHCIVCGKSYRTARKWSRFCSGKCRTEYRRIHKLDYVVKRCAYCGKEFKADKYNPGKYDSLQCKQLNLLKRSMLHTRGTMKLPSGNYVGQFSFKGKKYHTKVFAKEIDAYNARVKMMQDILNSH